MPGWAIGLICVGALMVIIFLTILPIGTWFRSIVSGSRVSISKLVGMKMRKLNYKLIVDCYITTKKAGLKITIDALETHVMAGGRIKIVVDALILAHRANINLSIDTARAIDLAGRDVLNEVKNKSSDLFKEIEVSSINAANKGGARFE